MTGVPGGPAGDGTASGGPAGDGAASGAPRQASVLSVAPNRRSLRHGGGSGASRPGRPVRAEAGLSLLEAIVALALTLVVFAALYGAVRPALVLNRSLPAMADAQQRMRHAFDRLHAELMTAGRGTARVEPGPISRMLPAVVPYLVGRRARDDEHRRVRPDAISVLSASPDGGAETRLLDALAGPAPEARLAPGPGCAGAACGYRAGDLVLVFDDRPAWGLFRVRDAGETALRLEPSGPTATAFEAGAAIAPIDVRHYYLDEEQRQLRRYDGWRGDFPLLDGAAALAFRFFGVAAGAGGPCRGEGPGAPRGRLEEIPLERFTDGPWCGPAGSPFDADLLRVRAICLDIRIEGAAAGPVSVPPPASGPASGGGEGADGYHAAFVVAPPNLQTAGTRALR